MERLIDEWDSIFSNDNVVENKRIKLVESKQELDELLGKIDKYAIRLKDGTNINFRANSRSGQEGKSGNETIDIKLNTKTKWKIHY